MVEAISAVTKRDLSALMPNDLRLVVPSLVARDPIAARQVSMMREQLAEFLSLPTLPPGFVLQFHTDGRSYAFSLKDGRDACRFAIFSDQHGYLYGGVPHRPRAILTPLDTR